MSRKQQIREKVNMAAKTHANPYSNRRWRVSSAGAHAMPMRFAPFGLMLPWIHGYALGAWLLGETKRARVDGIADPRRRDRATNHIEQALIPLCGAYERK